jgi:hypothetical protein
MEMSTAEIREGLRDGTVVFCLPPAHENFTNEFLKEFSQRILGLDWLDIASRSHLHIPALLDDDECMEEVMEAIRDEYGADVSDLPGLPFWEVIRRCASVSP